MVMKLTNTDETDPVDQYVSIQCKNFSIVGTLLLIDENSTSQDYPSSVIFFFKCEKNLPALENKQIKIKIEKADYSHWRSIVLLRPCRVQ